MLYIKEEIYVKVSLDNVAVVGELKPITRRQTVSRMLVHTSDALENGASSALCL